LDFCGRELSHQLWRMTAIIKKAGAKDRTGFFGFSG
jgi:hypothetical protein